MKTVSALKESLAGSTREYQASKVFMSTQIEPIVAKYYKGVEQSLFDSIAQEEDAFAEIGAKLQVSLLSQIENSRISTVRLGGIVDTLIKDILYRHIDGTDKAKHYMNSIGRVLENEIGKSGGEAILKAVQNKVDDLVDRHLYSHDYDARRSGVSLDKIFRDFLYNYSDKEIIIKDEFIAGDFLSRIDSAFTSALKDKSCSEQKILNEKHMNLKYIASMGVKKRTVEERLNNIQSYIVCDDDTDGIPF